MWEFPTTRGPNLDPKGPSYNKGTHTASTPKLWKQPCACLSKEAYLPPAWHDRAPLLCTCGSRSERVDLAQWAIAQTGAVLEYFVWISVGPKPSYSQELIFRQSPHIKKGIPLFKGRCDHGSFLHCSQTLGSVSLTAAFSLSTCTFQSLSRHEVHWQAS